MNSKYDVVIVGAGISGISAAYHLQSTCPTKTYAILESRASMGGTWDLFKYPGVRSDSDMYTLGFGFKPWCESKSIAHGATILGYVKEAAQEHRIDEQIHYDHRLEAASWSDEDATWTLTVRHGTEAIELRCNFMMMCSGYYDYEHPHDPGLDGLNDFAGTLVHPQHWPAGLDYANKRIAVIGSGATAMTLVPALAEDAASVTLIQRSPTYVVSRPSEDNLARRLNRWLPTKWGYALTRFKNVQMQRYVYHKTRTAPEDIKRKLLAGVRHALGPDYDVERHFTPTYNPWDQRLCLIPDGDLFEAIRANKARMVTERIQRVIANGVALESGEVVEADILVTATGLKLLWFGGARIEVNGAPVEFSQTFTYKGMMYSGVPNLVHTFGYVIASWTLRADLTSAYACRVIDHMDRLGVRQVTPRLRDADEEMAVRPWIEDFLPGYIRRSLHEFPKQGGGAPWVNSQNFAYDKKLAAGRLNDGALIFE